MQIKAIIIIIQVFSSLGSSDFTLQIKDVRVCFSGAVEPLKQAGWMVESTLVDPGNHSFEDHGGAAHHLLIDLDGNIKEGSKLHLLNWSHVKRILITEGHTQQQM